MRRAVRITFEGNRWNSDNGSIGKPLFRRERCDDIGRPRAPIKTSENRFIEFKSIHERDDIDRERGRLPVPQCVTRKKTRRAVAADIRNDDPVAG